MSKMKKSEDYKLRIKVQQSEVKELKTKINSLTFSEIGDEQHYLDRLSDSSERLGMLKQKLKFYMETYAE